MPKERDKTRRRWSQFRLRTLAVLIAIAGSLFWSIRKYMDRIHEKEQVDVAVAQVELWGGAVAFENPTPRGLSEKILLWCEVAVMGEDFTASPVAVSISAYDIQAYPALYDRFVGGYVDVMPTLMQLPSMRRLKLSEVRLTEDSIAQLGSLTNLEVLYLEMNDINGRWVRHLSNLKKVKRLSIRFNVIQDEDLKHLQELTELEELYLDGTLITPDGFRYLSELENLKRVSWCDPNSGQIGHSGPGPVPRPRWLTGAELTQIEASLPHCQILLDGPIWHVDVTD